jgi:hypothetical protein
LPGSASENPLTVNNMNIQDPYIDEIFHYQGKWEMPSLCGLKIIDKGSHHQVVLTELYTENPGSSVTEMILFLAERLVKERKLDPGTTEFIVRNPERSSHYEFFAETFHRAVMQWDGERFDRLKWEKISDRSSDE